MTRLTQPDAVVAAIDRSSTETRYKCWVYAVKYCRLVRRPEIIDLCLKMVDGDAPYEYCLCKCDRELVTGGQKPFFFAKIIRHNRQIR